LRQVLPVIRLTRFIRTLVAHPGFWSVAQQVGRQVVAYGIFVLLGALLHPRDFGVVALAATAIGFITIFADLGFGAALVQRREITSGHINAVFLFNIVATLALALLCFLLSWPIATAFHTPTLQPVLVVLALAFVVNGFGLTQMALAQRALQFRDLAVRDLVGTFAGGAVAVGMAIRGFGVWSLVAQTLVSATVGTALLWRLSSWRPRIGLATRASLGDLWSYSGGMLSFSILKFFTQNSDALLVGFLMGPLLLGYYSFALKVTVGPMTILAGAVGSYLFASLARLQGRPDDLRQSYLRYAEALLTIVLPLLTAVACLGPAMAPVILGDRWRPIAPLIPLFSVAAGVIVLISPIGSVLKAVGRVRWLVSWSAFFTSMILLAVATGSRWGIVGVAIGFAGAHILAATVAARLLHRSIGVTLGQLLAAMRTGVALSLVVASSVGIVWLVPGLVPLARVAIWLVVCAAACAMYMRQQGAGAVGRAVERWWSGTQQTSGW
jgi:PST family polysaccharide transporter